MRARIFLFLLATGMTAFAQSPTPIVVQAEPTAAKVIQTPQSVGNDATSAANVKMLRELKAANDEILKKQKAALEALDELQKAADQIKVFTKRT